MKWVLIYAEEMKPRYASILAIHALFDANMFFKVMLERNGKYMHHLHQFQLDDCRSDKEILIKNYVVCSNIKARNESRSRIVRSNIAEYIRSEIFEKHSQNENSRKNIQKTEQQQSLQFLQTALGNHTEKGSESHITKTTLSEWSHLPYGQF